MTMKYVPPIGYTPEEKLIRWNSVLDCIGQIKTQTATLGMIPMSIHGEVEILEALVLMEMRHLESAVANISTY